jgi:protein involved in polysaccharide export with SLBB domain
LNVIGDDPLLRPGASIVVEREILSGERSMQGVVQISGEVRSPGSVVIQPGVTTLRQAIAMAGGLGDKAALSLAYVARPDADAPPHQNSVSESYRSFQYSDLTLEDTLRYRLDQMFRLPYVSCDFVHAFNDSTSPDNIVLQNGDIIVVPTTPDRVYVYGQVSQPGYVAYQPGKSLDWYVDQAGGYATGAKEARARIIKGKTKVWVEEGEGVVVYPGDEVYVPRAPDVPRGTELQTWAIVAGIVSSIVALTATVMTLATR